MIDARNKLTELQLELLKSFKHVTSKEELDEIKSLLNLYFRHKLDAAIDKAELDRNLSAEVYNEWLNKPKNNAA